MLKEHLLKVKRRPLQRLKVMFCFSAQYENNLQRLNLWEEINREYRYI